MTTSRAEKAFECHRCQRTFARLEHLQRHDRSRELSSDQWILRPTILTALPRLRHQGEAFWLLELLPGVHKEVNELQRCLRALMLIIYRDLLVRHNRLTHSEDGIVPPTSQKGTKRRKSAPQVTQPKQEYQLPRQETAPDDYNLQQREWNQNITPLQHQQLKEQLHSVPAVAEVPACLMPVAPNTHINVVDPQLSNTLHQSLSVPYPNPNAFLGQPNDFPYNAYSNPDDFGSFLDTVALPTYQFSSTYQFEQPLPYFSPDPIIGSALDFPQQLEENGGVPALPSDPLQSSFSRLGSRLPSLQPEDRQIGAVSHKERRPYSLAEVTVESRNIIVERINQFSEVLPEGFQLMSRHGLSRYLAGYVTGFHEHLPFLHLATLTIENSAIELVLALASVGAQYCREPEKSFELFHVAKAVTMERIRRRNYRVLDSYADGGANMGRSISNGSPAENGYAHSIMSETTREQARDSMVESAQALLLLMAEATWFEHKPPAREALAIRSVLASLVRDDGLERQVLPADALWEDWIKFEGTKRTKFIIFSFFNIHTIVFDMPPMIVSGEVHLDLPSTEVEWKAPSASAWQEARRRASPESNFSEAFLDLFKTSHHGPPEGPPPFSTLGGYVLIHALIQHIWLIRQVVRCTPNGEKGLPPTEISSLENALKNWQAGWLRNPESSVTPLSPHGPLSSNATALLRLAYIRINIDTGPVRALGSWNPIQIATSIIQMTPPIERNKRITRATLHCVHALSIPIKLGINYVAHTQMFFWSTQHALCSLECALLLTKWLEVVTVPFPDPPLNDEEKKVLGSVMQMVAETEYAASASHLLANNKRLSAIVVRVWAKLFRTDSIWETIDLIGRSMRSYADMLEQQVR